MKNKRGSHVGIVISFIMFIVFVIFMYAILSFRIDVGEDKKSSLESVQNSVYKEVSGNVTTTSIKINSAPDCVQFRDFSIVKSNNIIVVGGNSILGSARAGTNLDVQRSGSTLVKIYESAQFSPVSSSSLNCDPLDASAYTVGLSKTENILFESRILDLFGNYSANYTGLKLNLGISENDDFGIVFTYMNGTNVRTEEKNVSIDVYASQDPVLYFGNSGKIETGFIDVILW